MADQIQSAGNGLKLFIYWLVVGIPLAWGIWTTLLKLPAFSSRRSSPTGAIELRSASFGHQRSTFIPALNA
jgi:hypothetical protein